MTCTESEEGYFLSSQPIPTPSLLQAAREGTDPILHQQHGAYFKIEGRVLKISSKLSVFFIKYRGRQ